MIAEKNTNSPTSESQPAGVGVLFLFFGVLLGMALLKLVLGMVTIPRGLLLPTSIFVSILYFAAPVFALYKAASYPWTAKLGVAFIVVGLLLHAGFHVLFLNYFGGRGTSAALALAVRDVGFFTWCVGLGALLSTLLKDKNLLIPVSIFLAAFDIFLVLTPLGPVQRVLQHKPELVKAAAVSVPTATSTSTGGVAQIVGYIGPADFIFMAMFFIALYKFDMRTRTTAIALIPAILVYLCILLFGITALPLLVPIGLTVLLVNATLFKLNKEEWASTALVAGIAIALIVWGSSIKRPAEPSTQAPAQAPAGQANSPAPASPSSP